MLVNRRFPFDAFLANISLSSFYGTTLFALVGSRIPLHRLGEVIRYTKGCMVVMHVQSARRILFWRQQKNLTDSRVVRVMYLPGLWPTVLLIRVNCARVFFLARFQIRVSIYERGFENHSSP